MDDNGGGVVFFRRNIFIVPMGRKVMGKIISSDFFLLPAYFFRYFLDLSVRLQTVDRFLTRLVENYVFCQYT